MKMRWLLVSSLMAASLAFAARAMHTRPGIHLNFSSPGTEIEIHTQIVGPDHGIVGPDRAETRGIIICASHTLRVTFSTTSTAGAEAAQGAALAAMLGFMQGLSPAELAKIIAPDVPVGIIAPDFQLRGGAFETDHVLAVSAQLETALSHAALDQGGKSPVFEAYQAASAALGAAVSCK